MITINNDFLAKEFEAFKQLQTKEEKQVFIKNATVRFDKIESVEQKAIRNSWVENLSKVDNRLKEISAEIKAEKMLEVYPANEEEFHLLEAILQKMNIRFAWK